MRDEIDHQRRRFFRSAALTFAAAPLVMGGIAEAETAKTKAAGTRPVKPGTTDNWTRLIRERPLFVNLARCVGQSSPKCAISNNIKVS